MQDEEEIKKVEEGEEEATPASTEDMPTEEIPAEDDEAAA